MRTATSAIILLATGALVIGCSRKEPASAGSTGPMSNPAGASTSATSSTAATGGDKIIR